VRKINVLHVVLLMDAGGGLEHVTLDLCKGLNKARFNVYLLCLKRCAPSYVYELSKHNISVFTIKKSHKFDICFYKKFINLVKNLKVDIIHIHSGCLFDSTLCMKMAGIKGSIYTAHGMPICTDIVSWFQDFISARLLNKVVAVSDEIADDFKKRLRLSQKKIEVLYNGVDVSLFKPITDKKKILQIKKELALPAESTIIGSVGRHEEIKNYGMLIRAFKKLISLTNKRLHLVLVGDGTKRHELEELCGDLKIEKFVSFLNLRHDIPEILGIFDIFVLSSISEGLSIALLEAQATGIPTVVTDVGGNGKVVVDGFNGFLYKVNEEDQLCTKIKTLLDDNDKKRDFSINSRERVKQYFCLKSIISKYENIYQKLFVL
jgi:glycosyltransferase involved in cell wall biosynthesis